MINESVSAILSIFIPPFIDLVNVRVKNDKLRYWVAILASAVIGFVVSFFSGEFDVENILKSVGTSFIVSQTVYRNYWNKSDVRDRLKASL